MAIKITKKTHRHPSCNKIIAHSGVRAITRETMQRVLNGNRVLNCKNSLRTGVDNRNDLHTCFDHLEIILLTCGQLAKNISLLTYC